MNDAVEQVLALARERFGTAKVSPADDIVEALGIDSFEALELVTLVEERFGVQLPDHLVQNVQTFQDLANLISSGGLQ